MLVFFRGEVDDSKKELKGSKGMAHNKKKHVVINHSFIWAKMYSTQPN